MTKEDMAQFHVTITSVEDGTWQGVVETDGKRYRFQSELQLLNWMMMQCPVLRPEVVWESKEEIIQ